MWVAEELEGDWGVLGGKRDWEREGLGGRYDFVLGHTISAIRVLEVSMVEGYVHIHPDTFVSVFPYFALCLPLSSTFNISTEEWTSDRQADMGLACERQRCACQSIVSVVSAGAFDNSTTKSPACCR